MKYKHYIKTDQDNNIIDAFSSWQHYKFDGTEILYQESIDRHFSLELIDFESGLSRLQYVNKKIIEKDIKAEKSEIIARNKILSELSNTDKDISRISEDLINLLDSKNILKKSDFSGDVKIKLARRKELREQL